MNHLPSSGMDAMISALRRFTCNNLKTGSLALALASFIIVAVDLDVSILALAERRLGNVDVVYTLYSLQL